MNKSLLWIVFLLLSAEISFAQIDIGNGGNVIACGTTLSAKNKKYSLLDFAESSTRYKIKVELDKDVSSEEYMRRFLWTVEQFSPNKALIYRSWINTFLQEARLLENASINPSHDAIYPSIPNNCHVLQVVLQKIPYFDDETRYYIDEQIWKRLDPLTKAGLITHEIILRDLLENSDDIHSTEISTKARYLNSLIWSGQILSMDSDQLYRLIIEKMNFKEIEIHGLRLSHFTSSEFMHYNSDSDTYQSVIKKNVHQIWKWNQHSFSFSDGGLVLFDKRHRPQKLLLYGPVEVRGPDFQETRPVNILIDIEGDRIQFKDYILPYINFESFRADNFGKWTTQESTKLNYHSDSYVCSNEDCISYSSNQERAIFKLNVSLKPNTKYKVRYNVRASKSIEYLYFKVFGLQGSDTVLNVRHHNYFMTPFDVSSTFKDTFKTSKEIKYSFIFDLRGRYENKFFVINDIKVEEQP